MTRLPFERQIEIVAHLVEGSALCAIERLCHIHRGTIMHLALSLGEACNRLHNAFMHDLQVQLLQLDETWSYIFERERRMMDKGPIERGDSYTYIGLDAIKKAIISYRVGKRCSATTDAFALDLRARIINRPQITTDGSATSISAVARALDGGVDYATLSNTIDFSKQEYNHAAAVALYTAHYNFCRVHETLRTTPCVALGIAERAWSIGELMEAAWSIAPVHDKLPLTERPSSSTYQQIMVPLRRVVHPTRPIQVVWLYAFEDVRFRYELEGHLATLRRQRHMESWHVGLIQPGADREAEQRQRLKDADLVVVLVSADLVRSDGLHEDLQLVLHRQAEERVRVVPVLVRPVDLAGSSLEHFQPLPDDGKSVSEWHDGDKALANIAAGLRCIVMNLLKDQLAS